MPDRQSFQKSLKSIPLCKISVFISVEKVVQYVLIPKGKTKPAGSRAPLRAPGGGPGPVCLAPLLPPLPTYLPKDLFFFFFSQLLGTNSPKISIFTGPSLYFCITKHLPGGRGPPKDSFPLRAHRPPDQEPSSVLSPQFEASIHAQSREFRNFANPEMSFFPAFTG